MPTSATPVQLIDPATGLSYVAGAGAPTSDASPSVTRNAQSGTATPTSVAASTSAVTLLAANTSRRGATVYYDGSAILYLLEGTGTPSSTNFTTKLGAGYYTQYDSPEGFVGTIKGIWSAATGAANVTERTA